MTMLAPDFSSRPRPDTSASSEVPDPITELLRGHARELIAVALETEVQLVLNRLRGVGRDIVRNGYLPGRFVTTAVGDLAVSVPRIRARDGESVNFASSMILKIPAPFPVDLGLGRLRLPEGDIRARRGLSARGRAR